MAGTVSEDTPSAPVVGPASAVLPFLLFFLACVLPVAWAAWAHVAIGASLSTMHISDYLPFAWFGSVLGLFCALASVILIWVYSHAKIAVRWRLATTIGSVAYVVIGLLLCGWIYLYIRGGGLA